MKTTYTNNETLWGNTKPFADLYPRKTNWRTPLGACLNGLALALAFEIFVGWM